MPPLVSAAKAQAYHCTTSADRCGVFYRSPLRQAQKQQMTTKSGMADVLEHKQPMLQQGHPDGVSVLQMKMSRPQAPGAKAKSAKQKPEKSSEQQVPKAGLFHERLISDLTKRSAQDRSIMDPSQPFSRLSHGLSEPEAQITVAQGDAGTGSSGSAATSSLLEASSRICSQARTL